MTNKKRRIAANRVQQLYLDYFSIPKYDIQIGTVLINYNFLA